MPSEFEHYKPTEPPAFRAAFLVFLGHIPDDEIHKMAVQLEVFDIKRDDRGGTVYFRYTDYGYVLALRHSLDAWRHEYEAREVAAGNARIDQWLADYRADNADDLNIVEIPCSYWKDGEKHEFMKKCRVAFNGHTSLLVD